MKINILLGIGLFLSKIQSLHTNADFYPVAADQRVYTFKCGPDPPGAGHLGSMLKFILLDYNVMFKFKMAVFSGSTVWL